jgi:DNA repair photolyase
LDNIVYKFPSVFQYTITGYGENVEPHVPTVNESVTTFATLSSKYGKDKMVWRFDPIFYDSNNNEIQTIERFQYIIAKLHDYTNRVIVNFCTPYEKVKKNFPEIHYLTDTEKVSVMLRIIEIAKQYEMTVQTCGNGKQFNGLEGIEVTGCIDDHALSVLGINPKKKNSEKTYGCLCYPNTSIGAYNTCMHMCKYCYASSNFDTCRYNFGRHNPNSPMLIGDIDETRDQVVELKGTKVGK